MSNRQIVTIGAIVEVIIKSKNNMKNRDFIYDMKGKKKKLCGIDLVLQNSQWKIWEGKRWVYAFVQHNKSVYIVNPFSFSFFVYWFYTQYLKSHLVLDIRVTFKGTRDNDLFEKDIH